PATPRIIGAPPSFIARGGFSWSRTEARSEAEEENPWLLLRRETHEPSVAIPAIGDENTVLWILKLGLGDELAIVGDGGQTTSLRIAGVLSRRIFQDALVIGEADFERAFPHLTGRSTFLIEADPDLATELIEKLEADLEAFGFDATRTSVALAEFAAVENTYLETFFVLGGLGLVLGTFGLAAALLRGVLERRGELALLRAVGFSHRHLGTIVLAESVSLLIAGIVIGAACALIATYPLRTGGDGLSW